ncbi:MAG: hypothetical protein AAGA56_27175, partial [Myxococcota bacterium]
MAKRNRVLRGKRGARTAWGLARGFRIAPFASGDPEDEHDPECYELAWDGHPVLVAREGDDVHIASADFQKWHPFFAPLVIALRRLPSPSWVGEGFLCDFDDEGKPCFGSLRRAVKGDQQRTVMVVWDLLYLEGRDLRAEPWRTRRAELARLLKGASSRIASSQTLLGPRAEVLRAVRARGLLGIVGRDPDATYGTPRRMWP